MATQSRKASIEKIKNEGTENEPDGSVKKITSCIGMRCLEQRTLENFERGGEPAKQISRRHQIGQEIDFRWLFVH